MRKALVHKCSIWAPHPQPKIFQDFYSDLFCWCKLDYTRLALNRARTTPTSTLLEKDNSDSAMVLTCKPASCRVCGSVLALILEELRDD